jgi:hypothetical protein
MPGLQGGLSLARGVAFLLEEGSELLLAGSQLDQILLGWLAFIFLKNLVYYLFLGRHLLLLIVPEPSS